MDKTTLKQLKPGTLFRLKDSESSPVWVRDHYDRSSTYSTDFVNQRNQS